MLDLEKNYLEATEFNNKDLPELIKIYKEKGFSAINITLENGFKLTLVFNDILYLKRNKINFKVLKTPRTTINIQSLKFKNNNETLDKNKIFTFNHVKAEFDELLSDTQSKNIEDLFSLIENKETLVGILPKTEYQIIGNFLFIEQAGEIVLEKISEGIWDEFQTEYLFDNSIGNNVTFNINAIKKIIPYEIELEIKDSTWKNYFKQFV